MCSPESGGVFVRVEQFTLKPGAEEKAIPLLREHARFIAGSPGCARGYLASPIHGTSYMVYGEWASEIHLDRMEATLRSNPAASEAFFGLMGLLRSPPHVARFQVLE
jgi:quinol monooxygenase YgiN